VAQSGSVLVWGTRGREFKSHRPDQFPAGGFGKVLEDEEGRVKFTIIRPIHIDPEILGGIPVIYGTRVPVQSLFDYLEAGDPLEVFLDNFQSVSKEMANRVLEWSKKSLG
jgi:uncharacterized protein (DUF433 family)